MHCTRPSIPSTCDTPLIIFQSELTEIENETLRWPDRETGGEMFGYFTYAGWPVVHRVINANGAARRGSATFHPDAGQIAQEGRNLIDRYGLQHLGQWHSHHRFSLTHPSGVDRTTVAKAIRAYGLKSFTQVIANIRSREGSATAMAHAYLYRETQPDQCLTMPWLVLPGTSPMRDSEGEDCKRVAAIQLEPQVVTWAQMRGEAIPQVIADSDAPIHDPLLLNRLGEELRLLDGAGVVARGRPAGRHLRIDATHMDRRFVILLAPDFPSSPPAVRRIFDGAPDVKLEHLWSPERRIVELLVEPSVVTVDEKMSCHKRQIVARAMTLLCHKRRQLGALVVSARARVRRKGVRYA